MSPILSTFILFIICLSTFLFLLLTAAACVKAYHWFMREDEEELAQIDRDIADLQKWDEDYYG